MAEAEAEWFPSEEWLDAYRTNLNDSERYREESEGWGVGFEGDFVFEIRDLPVEETTVGELPEELPDGLRESVGSLPEERAAAIVADGPPELRERMDEVAGDDPDADDRERLVDALLGATIAETPPLLSTELEDELPADLSNLLAQLDDYVEAETVRVHLDLRDGECRAAEVLEPGASPEPGFALRGPYGNWKDLVSGADVMESVLGEALELDGSVTTVIQYADAAQEMGDVANRTPSKPLF